MHIRRRPRLTTKDTSSSIIEDAADHVPGPPAAPAPSIPITAPASVPDSSVEYREALEEDFTHNITAPRPEVEVDDVYIGCIREVSDPQVRDEYLRIGQRHAQNRTLSNIVHTYSESLIFGRHHLAHFKKGFNMLDPHLVFPCTHLTEGGGLTPVRYINMIDTRTNMSVGETLRMLKVMMREVTRGTTRL